MSETHSTYQLKRGAKAPEFELPEGGSKKKHSLSSLAEGKEATVVIFACNHCPYVISIADEIGVMAEDYAERKVQFVAINSNDFINYPADAPEKMKEFAEKHEWKFPYLLDESQQVALSYSAACTPDIYVFNRSLELTYAGQFDGSRPGNACPITGNSLRAALEATLKCGKADAVKQWASSGCNIKWKEGNEPSYFG